VARGPLKARALPIGEKGKRAPEKPGPKPKTETEYPGVKMEPRETNPGTYLGRDNPSEKRHNFSTRKYP